MSVTVDPAQGSPAAPPSPDRGKGAGVVAAALLALSSVAGATVIAYLALRTARGQELDDRAMRIFSVNGDPEAARPLLSLLGDVSVGSAGLALVVFVGLALLRRGFALAAGAAVLVAGANLSTQLLKHVVLTRPDLDYGTLNSLPSGHTTLVFSLVLAAVLVAPSALRVPVTLVGAAVGTLTGATTVIAGWHRPSDVVVSILVTLAWGAAVAAVLAVVTPGARRPAGGAYELLALLGAGAAAVLLVTLGVRPGSGSGELLAAVLALGSVGLASSVAVGVFARLLGRTVG